MVYTDSSGKKHVSLSEARKGHAAQSTASRNARGEIAGSSSGSRYAREQESKEQASFQSTPRYSSLTLQPQPTNLPLRDRIPQDAVKPAQTETQTQKQTEKQSLTFTSRIKKAFSEGFKAGEGKTYSLEGLQAPEHRVQDMHTYGLAEKANSLSSFVDSIQNRILSPLPEGHGKDVVRGVSNIPEMAIGAAGTIPLGVETIVRNPKSSLDHISFGLGAMAGATVEKAKTHPGELAGEVIGSVLLGKVGGSLEGKIKPTITKEKFGSFVKNESGSFGNVQILKEKSIPKPKPMNQELAYKPKPETSSYELVEVNGKLEMREISIPSKSPQFEVVEVDGGVMLRESLPSLDLSTVRAHGETRMSAFKAEQKRITAQDMLHEHMSQQAIARPQIELSLSVGQKSISRNVRSLKTGSKMTQAQKNAVAHRSGLEQVQQVQQVQKTEVVQVQRAEALMKPKLEQVQKAEVMQVQKTESVLEPKILQTQKQTISQVQKTGSILEPKILQTQKVRNMSIAESFAYTLPFAAQAFNLQPAQTQTQKQNQKLIPELSELPVLTEIPVTTPVTKQKHKPLTLQTPISDSSYILPIDPFIPDMKPTPGPNPPSPIDPFIPDIKPRPGPNPPSPIDPTPYPPIDPYIIPDIKPPKPFPMDDISIGSSFDLMPPKQHRKTKKKTLKNEYGDPFKIKLKL